MWRRAFVLVMTATLISAPAASLRAQEKPKKYALLVGVNQYQHAQLDKLDFAEADATDMAKLLKDKGEYEVVTLVGKDATKARITKELEKLAQQGNAGGIVLVGFAGHGMQPEGSDEAYFVPFDAKQKVVTRDGREVNDWDYDSMVSLSKVLAHVKASPAGAKALLVDACRNDPKAGRGRGFGSNLKLSDLPRNLAVLLSCSEGERSFEHPDWGHGAFFYHVIKGMEEQVEKKKRVTALTLAAFVKENVSEAVPEKLKGGARQNPHPLINNDVDFALTVAATSSRPVTKDGDFENQISKMPEAWAQLAKVAFGDAGDKVSCFLKDGERRCWVAGKRAGRPAVILLEDTDGDGKADRSSLFATDPDVGIAERIEVIDKRIIIVHERQRTIRCTDSFGNGKFDKFEVTEEKKPTSGGALPSRPAVKLDQGLRFLRGRDVARDSKRALELIRESADAGHAPAQYCMSEIYHYGYDAVKIDLGQVSVWLQKSADAEYGPSQAKFGLALKDGSLGRKDESEAAEWLVRAASNLPALAEKGDDFAQYWLGLLYAGGNGLEKNETLAEKWFRTAAAAENAMACWHLAARTEPEEAIRLIRRAAEQGHAGTQLLLGLDYELGKRVARDESQAVQWIRRSAEQRYAFGQGHLARMYQFGKGVPKDREEAIKWHRLAARQGVIGSQDALRELGVEP